MWKWIYRIFKIIVKVIASISFILGFAGHPEDYKTWEGWIDHISNLPIMNSIFNNPQPINYVLIFFGILLFNIGYVVAFIKKIISPIKIKYKKDHPDYYHEAWGTKHHVICIENTVSRTIEDVSIELTSMKPRHDVFKTLIPMPLEKSINLNPGNNFFTLIQWVYIRRPEYYGIISNNRKNETKFTVDDKGHKIEVTVRGKNLLPVSKRFKFGIKRIHAENDIFWFKKTLF